ncbi:hypothetical protein O203_19185 [Ectopseudomonas chengduensis]|nr:hypothetical protein O203_19185 [Pseudomonas chengduensis]
MVLHRSTLPACSAYAESQPEFRRCGGQPAGVAFRARGLYAEDLCSEYLLGSIWLGRLNSPNFNAQAPLANSTLLKFTPQSAVYWQAEPSLMARLLELLTSVFGTKVKVPSVKPAMLCVELPPVWKLDPAESAT